ncbi:MAG: hypothetical protein H0T59_07000 [Chloroflexi bacterium]|nr:hypothetical protein [Chloroflexota bacterium]
MSEFAGRPRKIRHYEPSDHPGDEATADELARCATDKTASLNQHVIGYGAGRA